MIKNNKMTRKRWIYLLVCLAFLINMFIFGIKNSSVQSFWSDEMSTIGYIGSGATALDIIKGYITYDAVNLPLYPLMLHLIYNIVPYGEVYLLFPSILFGILSIVVIAYIGYLCVDEDVAFGCVCFGTISVSLMDRGFFDIRCYTLLILLCSISILLYIKRTENESWKHIILLGINMLLLFYTHWFGALLMIFYAFCDLIMWMQKKIHFRCIVSYLISGGLFLPWVIAMQFTNQKNMTTFHSGEPSLSDILDTFYYLSGRRWSLALLLTVSIFFVIGQGIYFLMKKRKINLQMLLFSLSILWLIAIIYLYGTLINPKGSFYEHKYFMVLFPAVFVLMSHFCVSIIKLVLRFCRKISMKCYKVCVILSFLLILIFYGKYAHGSYQTMYDLLQDLRMPYRQCAEVIVERKEIYNDDVLLLSAETCNLTQAWYDYYFQKRGFEIPQNTIAQIGFKKEEPFDVWDDLDSKLVYEKYNEIIAFRMSFEFSNEIIDFLNTYYDEQESYFADRIVIYKKSE